MDAALYWDNKALPTPNSKLYLHFLFILFFIYIIFYLYIYSFLFKINVFLEWGDARL